MKRKLIATLLVLGLMLALVPMTIFSTSAAANELRISTADDLVSFATNLKNGNKYAGYTVYIENDIDLSGKTWPLDGCYSSVFSGMIDGQGHTIKGVTWTTTTYSFQGLFGAKIQGTTADFAVGVKNLAVTDVTVKGTCNNGSYGAWGEACIGGLFGKLDATTVGTVLFDNLDLNITVDAPSGTRIGGMIGETRATSMTISNSIFRGTVNGKSEVGGLIGWQMDRNLTTANTVVSGSVTASGANCGGFYGQVRDMDGTTGAVSTITGCVFDGIVTTGIATAYAGGYVGRVGAGSASAPRPGFLTIQESASYGTIATTLTSGATHIAGLVGATHGGCNSTVTINNCIVAAHLTAPSNATGVGANIRPTVAVAAGATTVTISNVVGNTDGYLTSKSGTYISQKPAGSGTATMTNLSYGAKGLIPDGYAGTKFYNSNGTGTTVLLDLSETFVATTATKPLPMGVVRFYAEKTEGVSAGAATYAYGYQTKTADDKTAIRLIGLLKASENLPAYENVGLEVVAIRADGTTVKSVNNAGQDATNTVYTAVEAAGKTVTASEMDANYKYLFTYAVEGIEEDGGMITLVVRSFHEVDGVRTYDDTRVINYDPANA